MTSLLLQWKVNIFWCNLPCLISPHLRTSLSFPIRFFLPNKADPSTCALDQWLSHVSVHGNQVKSVLVHTFQGLTGRDSDAVGLRESLGICISARLPGGADAAITGPHFASHCLNPTSSCLLWNLVLSSMEYGLHEARDYAEFITEYSELSIVSSRKNIVKYICVEIMYFLFLPWVPFLPPANMFGCPYAEKVLSWYYCHLRHLDCHIKVKFLLPESEF